MNIRPLAQLAAYQVPYDLLESLPGNRRFVIDYEMSRLVQWSRGLRRVRFNFTCHCRNEDTAKCACACHVTNICLCYFTAIREEMIQEFWAKSEDYQILGDWC